MQRLNVVASVFAPLLEIIQREQASKNCENVWLMDSFPVALAKQGHRFKACVAKELADAGYCSTKKLYFYGVRVHVIGRRQKGTLPIPEYIGVVEASHHDGKVFEQIRPELVNNELYGDKAYQRPDAKEIREAQNLTVFTPVKKQKGQKYLAPEDQCGFLLLSLVFDNLLKHYLDGLKRKQALNVPAKCVHTMILWFMSLASWLLLCFFGTTCVLALNSHYN